VVCESWRGATKFFIPVEACDAARLRRCERSQVLEQVAIVTSDPIVCPSQDKVSRAIFPRVSLILGGLAVSSYFTSDSALDPSGSWDKSHGNAGVQGIFWNYFPKNPEMSKKIVSVFPAGVVYLIWS